MPKISLNPLRNNLSIQGLTLRHDELLDQPVLTTSDVMFKSLNVGDLHANGSIYFTGNITTVETTHLTIRDNIIDINDDNDVPLLKGGFAIHRGSGLTPFDILYDEHSKLLRLGFDQDLQAVATRQDDPSDGDIAIWNNTMARFDVKNSAQNPFTFENDVTIQKRVIYAPIGANASNAPYIAGESSGDLTLSAYKDIVLGASDANVGTSVVIPFGRKLSFGSSYIYSDPYGALSIDTSHAFLPAGGKLSWGSNAQMRSANGGSDLLAIGSVIQVVPTTSFNIANSSPFIHAGVATLQPISNGAYSIESTGDLYITQGDNSDIVVPSLSINKVVKFTADAVGNMNMLSSGDIFFSPKQNVILDPGKFLVLGGNLDMFITMDTTSNNMVINSNKNITLAATQGIYLPANVPLKLASNTTISETPEGHTSINCANNKSILLSGQSVNIPLGASLQFATGETITSDGQVLSLAATSQINLTAPLGINIPQGVPLLFGDSAHMMYQDTGNNMYLNSSHQIILKAVEKVTLDTKVLSLASTSIYEDVDGALTLFTSNAVNYVKSVNNFLVNSSDEATEVGSASLMTNGGLFVGKNLIVNRETTHLSKVNIVNTVFIDDTSVPILVTNSSVNNGTAIGFTAKWDFTGGYTIGRGTPDLGGGRAMMFTLPPYTSYGIGKAPNFLFGSANGDVYLSLDNAGMSLPIGKVYIGSNDDAALAVNGGITTRQLVSTGSLNAANNSLVVTALQTTVNTQLNVSNALYGLFDNGNQYLFKMDTTGNMFSMATAFKSSVSVAGSLIVNGQVTFTSSGLTLGGNLDVQSNRILNLRNPTTDSEPATKYYVDQFLQGLSAKEAVNAATTVEVDLTAAIYNLDDVVLRPGYRILVKDQSNAVQNGIYVLDANNKLSRSNDVVVGTDVSGSSVFVSSGTANGTTGYLVVGNPVIVGTNTILWSAFTGTSQINVGGGLGKDGNRLFVNVDNNTILINGGDGTLMISPSFISPLGLSGGSFGIPVSTSEDQSHVTKLGNITSGTWNADVISVARGGTGVTTVQKGYLMIGNGSDPYTTTDKIFIDSVTGNIGLQTAVPRNNLHLVNVTGTTGGTWMRIEDTAPLLTQSSGIMINSASNNAKIALRSDGTLYIGQDDFTNASNIAIATQRVTRLSIDNSGNTVIGSNTPISGSVLSIYGKFTSTGGANIRGDLVLPSITIAADSLGNTVFTTPMVKFSGAFDIGSDATVGNFSFISTVSGETRIISADRNTKLGLPLYLKTSASNTSAVCISGGMLVPGTLQIGGVVGDTASGFSVYTLNNNLHFTPGIAGSGVLFDAPMSFGAGLSIYDKAKPTDFITLSVNTTFCYLQTKTTTVSAPYNLVIGGGTNEIITTLINKAGSASITYDPTSTAEYAGGVFSVSSSVLSTFGSEVRLLDILRFNLGNGAEGVLGSAGWYYLGLLGTGRTTITASLSWRIRLDYDGVSQYSINLLNYDRNVVSLVVYKSNTGVYQLFIRVLAGPCRVSILESPVRLYMSKYEGGGATPSGQYSGYTIGWTVDLNSSSAQSNASLDFGSINVLGASTLNNATLNGQTIATGKLQVNGDTSLNGNSVTFSNPTTSLPKVSMGTDVDNVSNIVTIYGTNASSPALILNRTLVNGSVSMVPSSSTSYAGALLISHNNNDPSSQVLISTRGTPAFLVDGAGTTNVLSTVDSLETQAVAFKVAGGSIFSKRASFLSTVFIPELRLTNVANNNYIPLTCDNDRAMSVGNYRISNLADPVNVGDAVNMRYVQGLIQGLSAKESVTAASANQNITVSSVLSTLDDVTLKSGDRVLLKNQTNPVENGLYQVVSGQPPVRTNDLAVGKNASATFVFVSQGTANSNSGWICSTTPGQDVVGVNALTFTQFSGAGQFNAGAGLAKIGQTIQVLVDGVSLEISNNNLRVKSSIAGTGLTGGSGIPLTVSSVAHLDTVGTIKYGTWNASVIGMAYGGTGASSFGVGRVLYSNGISLTQGALYFDDTNVRLGINTTAPTSGLTLQDRDIQLTQTAGTPSYVLMTSSVTNYSFGIRNEASRLVISSGTGSNKLGLIDAVSLDSTGVLNVTNTIRTASLVTGTTRITAKSIESLESGAFSFDMFSLDNTGSYVNFYGGLGNSTSKTNSEFMRVGYYNASYTLQTGATGIGVVRSLTLQAGSNTNQFVLQSNGNAIVNANMYLNSTRDATSTSDGGAFTVLGGGAFAGSVFAGRISIASTADSSITSAGGISAPKLVVAGTYQNYSVNADGDGRLLFNGNRTSTESSLGLASYDANNANNVLIRLFGLGKSVVSTSEWLQMGFEQASATYAVRVQQGGAATSRPLVISATANSNQLTLNTDGSTAFSSSLQVSGAVSVTSTGDATSSGNTSGNASLATSGGLAVAKSLFVGTAANIPVVNISSYAELSASGSVDTVRLSYTSNGNVNAFNNARTTFNMHTGNSIGPTSPNQEKLILGYNDSTSHVVRSFASGTGVVRDLVLMTGNNTDQIRLSASDSSVRFAGSVTIQSTTESTSISTGAFIVSGGMGVGKTLTASAYVAGNNTSGNLLTLNGVATWAFSSIDATNTQLKALSANTTFSFGDTSGTKLFAVDSLNQVTTVSSLFKTAYTSTKAASVQNGAGIDMFVFDTVNHQYDMTGGRIVNVGYPQLSNDSATKSYVDNLIKGLNLKSAANVAAGVNVDLTKTVGLVDGVTVQTGWRVLLMFQTNAVENGLYVVNSNSMLSRADDLAVGSRAAGAFCFVEVGAFRGDKGYVCIADFPNDVVGTNALNFTQFNGNIISAGLGLYKDGNNVMNIDLDPLGSGLTFNGNHLRINSSIAGSGLGFTDGVLSLNPITSVGTVTAGSWQSSKIDVAFGGTGNNNFPGNQVVFSDGTKLTSSIGMKWDNTQYQLAIAGDPLPIGNENIDGLRLVNRDLVVGGLTPGVFFADKDLKYNWGMRLSQAMPNSSIKTVAPQPWRQISMSKDGRIVIFLTEPGYPDIISFNYGYNWSTLLHDGNLHNWGEIVMSYDGSIILLCASEGYLYISNNSGYTFSQALTDYTRIWEWCSISDNGQYMLASALADGMYASNNSGQTWILVSNVPTDVVDLGFVHVSKDGSVQYAGYFGGALFESRNNGSTFTQRTDIRNGQYYEMTESRNSNVLILYEDAGSIFVSTDLGVSWSEKLSDVARKWVDVTVSADGSAIAATESGGQIWFSSNYGVTWATLFNGLQASWNFAQITDDDLGVLAGGTNMPLYVTTDAGATFSQASTQNLTVYSGQIATNGLFYYGNYNGSIYRYLYTPSTNLVISGGKSALKSGITEFVVLSDRQQMGIGYDSTNAGYISSTLDVNGTLYVDNTVTFKTALGADSGGTGSNNLPYGLVIANGTDPFTTTYGLPSGGVPIGSTDGTGAVVVESGDTLRNHLGLAIGKHVQAWGARLDEIAALQPTNNYFIMGTGTSFIMGTASNAASSMGLGRLAYLDNVNNNYWSGTPLSVANGGTGGATFTEGIIPVIKSGAFANSTLGYDSTNSGLAVNGSTVPVGSGVAIYNSDLSILASVQNTNPGMLLHDTNGLKVFRMRMTPSSSFVISGGVPNADKTALPDRLSILSTGEVSILSTTNSSAVNTGALQVAGGASFGASVFVGGKVVVNDSTATALTVTGGITTSSSVSSATLTVSGQSTFSNSLEASSTTVAGSTFTGGVGIGKSLYVGKTTVIGYTSATVPYISLLRDDGLQFLDILQTGTGTAAYVSVKATTGSIGRIVVNNGTTDYLDMSSTSVSTIAPLTITNTSATAITTTGGISCGKTITSAGSVVSASINGEVSSIVVNTNTGTSAYSILRLNNSGNVGSIFVNSTTRTADGGTNGMTIRNDASGGLLRVQTATQKGMTLEATAGNATFDGTVTVSSTAIATSTTGAVVVLGGISVANSAYVTGDLTVTGKINNSGSVISPTITTVAGDLVNVTTITVKSAKVTIVNNQNMLLVNFKVTPTADSLNTQFTFNLPGRTTAFVESLDLDNGQCSGFTDTVNYIVLQNTLCTGVPGSTKAMVKFQSQSTQVHNLHVLVSYVAI